jgi:hypothetical protein
MSKAKNDERMKYLYEFLSRKQNFEKTFDNELMTSIQERI